MSADKPLPFFEQDSNLFLQLIEEVRIPRFRKAASCGKKRQTRPIKDVLIRPAKCRKDEQVFSICNLLIEEIFHITVDARNEDRTISTATIETVDNGDGIQFYFNFDKKPINQGDNRTLTINVTVETVYGIFSETLKYKKCLSTTSSDTRKRKKGIFPNPFYNTFTFQLELEKSTNINVSLYNGLGQFKAVIAKGYFDEGFHSIDYQSNNLDKGIYFIRYQDEIGDMKVMKVMKL